MGCISYIFFYWQAYFVVISLILLPSVKQNVFLLQEMKPFLFLCSYQLNKHKPYYVVQN